MNCLKDGAPDKDGLRKILERAKLEKYVQENRKQDRKLEGFERAIKRELCNNSIEEMRQRDSKSYRRSKS